MTGVLVLAATPIGDPADASRRLVTELTGADVIAAEDTRRLRRLMSDLEIETSARVIAYHEHNETERTPDLVAAVANGERVVLVTDAGMPSVSDPGFRAVRAVVDAGLAVTIAPGPSAVLAALALSGLPVDRFCFEGFLPRQGGKRRQRLDELTGEQRTMVFYEAPHRLNAMLTDLRDALGAERPAAVCREITKTYEEVKRATLAELTEWSADGVRGEIAVVVSGVDVGAESRPIEDLVGDVEALVAAGSRRKEAVHDVAHRWGADKRALYDASVAAAKAASKA